MYYINIVKDIDLSVLFQGAYLDSNRESKYFCVDRSKLFKFSHDVDDLEMMRIFAQFLHLQQCVQICIIFILLSACIQNQFNNRVHAGNTQHYEVRCVTKFEKYLENFVLIQFIAFVIDFHIF